MTNYENSPFEEYQEEPEAPQNEPGRGGGSNKTFIIVMAIIVGGAILLMGIMALIIPFFLSNRNASYEQQAALINAQNAATSAAATRDAQIFAQKLLATALYTPPTPTQTPPPTNTPVMVVSTATATEEGDEELPGADRTATISALLTGSPSPQVTDTATTTATPEVGVTSVKVTPNNKKPTALPNTGFADEVGLPGLFTVAGVLLVVIFLARRLRSG